MKIENVIIEIEDALSGNLAKAGNVYNLSLNGLKDKALTDALSLLKEQEEQINTQRKNLMTLLNKQEAVEPIRDANCIRMFRCGACGEYVGFIDSDPGDPNEQDNYCRHCGKKVKWDEID